MELNHSQAYDVLTKQMDVLDEALTRADKHLEFSKQAGEENNVNYFLGLRTGYNNAWIALCHARGQLDK